MEVEKINLDNLKKLSKADLRDIVLKNRNDINSIKEKIETKNSMSRLESLHKLINSDTNLKIELRIRDKIKEKSNYWYFNNELSMAAKGMMHYFIQIIKYSNNLNLRKIILFSSDDEIKTKKTIDELVEAGYLMISRLPSGGVRFDVFKSKFDFKPKYKTRDFIWSWPGPAEKRLEKELEE